MLKDLPGMIMKAETINHIGKIENITGMSMEASGGSANIGDIVLIYNEEQKNRYRQRWSASGEKRYSLWHTKICRA